MRNARKWTGIVTAAALVFATGVAGAATTTIKPGDNDQETLQEALILAQPGDIIELAEGTYHFTMGLSLDVDNVTLRGKGMDKTILTFKDQNAGSEGLTITSDGVLVADLAVEDTKGDAIKAKGSDGITFLNVRTEWTGGPKETNGAYGLYPVESKDVLIDGCVAIGASDAGIYVGQSQQIIVRNSRAEYNVAGIEIENSYYADVYNNVATNNTGGILVFDLPDLPQQGGHSVRVFDNTIVGNNTANFAPAGNIVASVPSGSGLMIMANNKVEVFENKIADNQTTNLLIYSYLVTGREFKDPNYDPYPEGIHIHHNTFGEGGQNPDGRMAVFAEVVGKPLPDIVWDGIVDDAKLVDGKVAKKNGIYIHDNGGADFINLDLGNFLKDPKSANISRDLAAHKGKLPRLKPVKLSQEG